MGETIAVALVLSSSNVVSKAILGPGKRDVAEQVALFFPVSNVHSQSEIILATLTLFPPRSSSACAPGSWPAGW